MTVICMHFLPVFIMFSQTAITAPTYMRLPYAPSRSQITAFGQSVVRFLSAKVPDRVTLSIKAPEGA